MITGFLMRRARKQREARSGLADALSLRLEQTQSLIVDDELVSSLGVEKNVFFRAVYAMVIQERIHMMADNNGRILLMTNREFHRFMLRQSGVRETEIQRREGIPALADAIAEHAVATLEEETIVIDAVDAELAESPAFVESPARAEPFEPAEFPESPELATLVADKNISQPDAPAPDDLAWFNLDVAPARASREKLPGARQTIPDRRREPWAANEESRIHF